VALDKSVLKELAEEMRGIRSPLSIPALDAPKDPELGFYYRMQPLARQIAEKKELYMSVCEQMRRIGREVNEQDNQCTAEPIFAVQEKRKIWGFDEEYSDGYCWVDLENEEADDGIADLLDEILKKGGDTFDWTRLFYRTEWLFVTAFLTAKGAEDYIERLSPELIPRRVYVYSGYDNKELQAIRGFFERIGDGSIEIKEVSDGS